MESNKQNQEFNKNIKQLTSMVKDKLYISLAENLYNLRNEMNGLARNAKEKETELLLHESKVLAAKTQQTIAEEKKVEISESVSKNITAKAETAAPDFSNEQIRKSPNNQNKDNYNKNNDYQTKNNQGYQNNYRNNQGYNQTNQYQSRPQGQSGYQNNYRNNQSGQFQNRPQGQSGYQNNDRNNQGYNQANQYQSRPQSQGGYQNNYQSGQFQNRPQGQGGYQNNYRNNQGYNQTNQYQSRPQGQGGYQNNYRNNQSGQFQNRPQGQGGYQNNYRNNQATGPFQNRPYNAAQRPPFNKDGKRPAINFAQPIITASPARNFGNKKKEGERHDEKKQYTKRDLLRRGMIEEQNIEERMLSRKIRSKKKDDNRTIIDKPQGPTIITTDNITIKLLAEVSGKPVSEIIKKFMILGMMVTINSQIDFQTAELAMSDLGIEIVQKLDKTSEEKLVDVQRGIRSYNESEATTRPPIVAVMGHVDHGKTSLLDYIRRTKVAMGEAGGITQSIGAYRVGLNDKHITFIDTPGHEAFTAMRARGASVTDIAILIVAADDGLMPQTIEAINHIKSAKVPMIVAINKMDKQQADPDRVMQQLAEHNVLPEAWGGDAVICKISAHTGEGIDKLLETILLMADMQDLKANLKVSAMGTIMEAKLDKGRGAIASLIVLDGSLKVGDTIVAGTAICKVKAMFDENNKSVKIAVPSMPVTVLGFSEVPSAGDTFTVVDEKLSKSIVDERKTKQKADLIKGSGGSSLEDLIQKTSEKDMKILNIVLKTDVNGSLEAIRASIMKLVNDEVKINILHSGVGAISESDLILANASNAMVIAFNIGQDSKVKTQAERMGITIYSYKIIYELLDELERVIKGMKEPKYQEIYVGRAEIMMVFKLTGTGIVAGSMVRDGKIVRGEHARVIRNGEVITTAQIKSVKIVKDDVKEAGKDRECGIKLNFDAIQAGDIIECYSLKRIEE